MTPDPTPVTWSGYIVRLNDGRLYRTTIGLRGTTRAHLYPDGTVVARDGMQTQVVPQANWPEWAYLICWIDPGRTTARWRVASAPRPTGRLDHICLLAMKQGGETYGMARHHLLAHLRLDLRYAPLLPGLEENGHA